MSYDLLEKELCDILYTHCETIAHVSVKLHLISSTNYLKWEI